MRTVREFRNRWSMLGWALCLLAAVVQAGLPVLHAGHAGHGGEIGEARLAAIGDPAHFAEVRGTPTMARADAACVLCQAIGMTRSALFQPSALGLVVDDRCESAKPIDGGVAKIGPRITSAAPRGPPARA